MNYNLEKDLHNFPSILAQIKEEANAYLSQINDLPTAILPPQLGDHALPENGLNTEGALQLFKEKFADLMAATTGPRYWGFVTGGTTPAALAGDWLTSLYDQNCQSSARAGDVSAVVEFETIKILRGLLGLPDAFWGGFVTGATMSNFIKKRLKYKVSSEFIETLLGLSKCYYSLNLEFIFKVTDKANELCEGEGKKTINSAHLYESLQVGRC